MHRRAHSEYTPDFLPDRGFTFVGVWDTVAAYGVPIDEIAAGLDRWVWPLKLPTTDLPPIVGKACHALALDDERQSFHPVLWDEHREPQDARHLDDERLSQVWFAGMHSNVGGGYPDDAMSHVPFKWLVQEACRRGLRFRKGQLARWLERTTPIGHISDSRRGVGAYYRYHPRHVRRLTNGQLRDAPWQLRAWRRRSGARTGVRVHRPKIHHSVFDRMRHLPGYTPIVLPVRYAVVTRQRAIIDRRQLPAEPDARQRSARASAQERAWDLVWWRRVLYFATIGATLGLALRPAGLGPDPERLPNIGIFLSALVSVSGSFLPAVLAPAVQYFSRYPLELIIGAGIIGGLLLASNAVQRRIVDSMHILWTDGARALPDSPWWCRLARGLRTSRGYIWAFAVLTRFVWPTAFGLAAWLVIVALVNRGAFEVRSSAGAFCTGGDARTVALDAPVTVRMTPGGFCQPTGVLMERGAQYRLDVVLPTGMDAWSDGSIPVVHPDGIAVGSPGLRPSTRLALAVAYPFRRVWRPGWFVPIARLGAGGADHYALAAATVFSARKDGELFLFVNDAVIPLGIGLDGFHLGFDATYRNNLGGPAVVTIRKLTERGAPRQPCGPDVRCEDSLM